ncbi:MAG: hypothetical protein H7Z71_07385 [Moraxellaceae bacterium]|nr:hypothetical protein [Pseudobdellovibrionaceae bacterium]
MNRRQRNELHVVQIELWKKKNANFSSDQMIHLFVNAIQAVHKRSLSTLSNVTVSAVIDRTLHECKEKFPLLSKISIEPEGLHFNHFLDQMPRVEQQEAQDSLEYLLIELFEIFGKITAEILTKYLYQELMTVTYEGAKIKSELPAVPSSKSVKNREKK